jgi:hypothetical protein
MMTVVPTEPVDGDKLVMMGVMMKLVGDVAVRPATVTLIGPVVAPSGTDVTISVIVELMTAAGVPLKLTVLLTGAGSKSLPEIVTVVPTVPLDGEKLLMTGGITMELQLESKTAATKPTMKKRF